MPVRVLRQNGVASVVATAGHVGKHRRCPAVAMAVGLSLSVATRQGLTDLIVRKV